MAWINLMPQRHAIAEFVKRYLDTGQPPDPPSILLALAQSAIELGDQQALSTIVQRGRPIYDDVLKRRCTKAFLGSKEAMGRLIALSCAYHVAGEEQAHVWASIGRLGRSRDPVVRALLSLLPGGSKDPEATPARPRAPRYPRTDAQMVVAVEALDRQTLLDIVNSPDHGNWGPLYQYFVLPLAIDVASRTVHGSTEVVSLGARPERRGALLYSRTTPRPERDASDRVVRDFDAVERFDDSIVAYHYLGLGWAKLSERATLSFREGASSLSFLDSLDRDWGRVRSVVAPRDWAAIDAARREGRCTHVVAYEPERTRVPEEALVAAGEHYGVKLVARSLFDI